MIKRLFAFLFGAPGARPAGREAGAYPVVGSAVDCGEETVLWRNADGVDPSYDVTRLAPPPTSPAVGERTAGVAARQRLAWPARDLSRSRALQPAPSDEATSFVDRVRPAARAASGPAAADDATVLVPSRSRPRPPAS